MYLLTGIACTKDNKFDRVVTRSDTTLERSTLFFNTIILQKKKKKRQKNQHRRTHVYQRPLLEFDPRASVFPLSRVLYEIKKKTPFFRNIPPFSANNDTLDQSGRLCGERKRGLISGPRLSSLSRATQPSPPPVLNPRLEPACGVRIHKRAKGPPLGPEKTKLTGRSIGKAVHDRS